MQKNHSMYQLLGLWRVLQDVPISANEMIGEPFMHFPAGTRREEIWRWFENQNPQFSVAKAMGQGRDAAAEHRATAPDGVRSTATDHMRVGYEAIREARDVLDGAWRALGSPAGIMELTLADLDRLVGDKRAGVRPIGGLTEVCLAILECEAKELSPLDATYLGHLNHLGANVREIMRLEALGRSIPQVAEALRVARSVCGEEPSAWGSAEDQRAGMHQVVDAAAKTLAAIEPFAPGIELEVSAEMATDDHVAKATFDASGWLEKLSSDALVELAEHNFGGCKLADQAAFHALRTCQLDVVNAFHHLKALNSSPLATRQGFEVYIDEDQALAWIEKNRPEVFERLREEGLQP